MSLNLSTNRYQVFFLNLHTVQLRVPWGCNPGIFDEFSKVISLMFCVSLNFWESQEGSFSCLPHQFLFWLHLPSSVWRSHRKLQTASKAFLKNLVAKHHVNGRKEKKITFFVCFWPSFDVIGNSSHQCGDIFLITNFEPMLNVPPATGLSIQHSFYRSCHQHYVKKMLTSVKLNYELWHMAILCAHPTPQTNVVVFVKIVI